METEHHCIFGFIATHPIAYWRPQMKDEGRGCRRGLYGLGDQ